jgi:hypothetical protein
VIRSGFRVRSSAVPRPTSTRFVKSRNVRDARSRLPFRGTKRVNPVYARDSAYWWWRSAVAAARIPTTRGRRLFRNVVRRGRNGDRRDAAFLFYDEHAGDDELDRPAVSGIRRGRSRSSLWVDGQTSGRAGHQEIARDVYTGCRRWVQVAFRLKRSPTVVLPKPAVLGPRHRNGYGRHRTRRTVIATFRFRSSGNRYRKYAGKKPREEISRRRPFRSRLSSCGWLASAPGF